MIENLLLLIFIHWIADFVIQKSEWQSTKSFDTKNLIKHTLTYSLLMFVGVEIMSGHYRMMGAQYWYTPLLFSIIQFVTHTGIDYVTSRVNSSLWKQKRTHDFFVSIGFDQVLHYVILFYSYKLLFL